jgi:hypothetical protein
MMPFARPYAYIRRSALRDGGDISRTFQTDVVRDLAGPDGSLLTIIDKDWGRSGATDETDKREAFLDLMAAVERGEVSAIYAYSIGPASSPLSTLYDTVGSTSSSRPPPSPRSP